MIYVDQNSKTTYINTKIELSIFLHPFCLNLNHHPRNALKNKIIIFVF